ncbi:helix-turn-helix domain-containing protein [Denitrobaculum tricleocarpae]|nr:AraC family transcriptional regulator [Denitrobaculum tricleocarpae]
MNEAETGARDWHAIQRQRAGQTRTIAGSTSCKLFSWQLSSCPGFQPLCSDLTIQLFRRGAAWGMVDLGAGRFYAHGRLGFWGVTAANETTQYETEISPGGTELTVLAIPGHHIEDLMEDAAGRRTAKLPSLHNSMHQDLIVRQLIECLIQTPPEMMTALYLDGIIQALVARLAVLDERRVPAAVCRGEKTASRLIEEIEGRLGENLTTDELGSLVDALPRQVHKTIVMATGTTPHQYVIERRVARAREMLAQKDLSLAEIAYTCGFSSQQHMTNVFSKRLGVSPGKYRREIRA